jgi:glycerophosphoryl diester phosphodiesterase
MRHDGDVELIAHRAGNEHHLVAPALAVADTVELDLHLFRWRLEVRHAKVIWPFAVFWEQWEFLPGTPHPPLSEILDATPDDAHLWFDLKGFTTRLPKRLLREVGDRRPMTASCRSWWALRPLRRVDGVRTFFSVASPWQLRLIQRFRFADHDHGIVMHERLATSETMSRLHQLTPNVVVWAVHDLERALELHRLGVSGIIADDLDLLERVRRHIASDQASDDATG